MDNIEIREHAQKMAADIQEIVDRYNRTDPSFSFFPVITMTETETSVFSIKSFSVDVEVEYNTKKDRNPHGVRTRQPINVDTSTNATIHGPRSFDRVNSSDKV